MFTATIENARELATVWVQVRAAIRGGMRRGVSQGVAEGAAEARAKHRFVNRTGNLERSIVGRVTGNRAGAATRYKINGVTDRPMTMWSDPENAHWGVIEATAKSKDGKAYASWVENGRGPVKAIRAQFLRFQIDGVTYFRKRVKAATPRPFMAFAYFKCERVMIREIERGVAEAQSILDR